MKNYLPLVPTEEDKEHFRKTGTHRKVEDEEE